MSSERDIYDIRKKLLNLQSELVKNFSEKPDATNNHFEQKTEASVEIKTGEPAASDITQMLKELLANQKKMISMLTEINNKLK